MSVFFSHDALKKIASSQFMKDKYPDVFNNLPTITIKTCCRSETRIDYDALLKRINSFPDNIQESIARDYTTLP